MIYCPKCHEVVKEIICPHCDTDIICYNEQKNNVMDEHFDTLRSNHRIMSGIYNNQKNMNNIMEEIYLSIREPFDAISIPETEKDKEESNLYTNS